MLRLLVAVFAIFYFGSAAASSYVDLPLCSPDRSVPLPLITWLDGNKFAYRADFPELAPISNTKNKRDVSPLELCEDGIALPRKNQDASSIVNFGAGRWNHYGASIWLSSTDGSNPILNGKRYSIDSEQIDVRGYLISHSPGAAAAIKVSAPLILILIVFGGFTCRLWQRGGLVMPFLDLGFWAAGTATAYICFAGFQFLLSGMTWSLLSDRRMLQIYPSPETVATFLWWGAAYVASFISAYLVLSRSAFRKSQNCAAFFDRSYGLAFVAVAVTAIAWQFHVEYRYGVQVVQNNIAINLDPWTAKVPLLIAQITQNSFGILNIAKIAIVVWLVSHFEKPWVKVALTIWLLIEAYSTVKVAGARTYFISLIIAAALSYHFTQKSLKAIPLAGLSLAIVAALIGYGCWRNSVCTLDGNTEFQTIMANPIHLKFLLDDGGVAAVPRGVRWAELLQFIPQQISPIQKIEPANWYGDVSGSAGSGTAFGVLAQGVAGFGLIEIILRGLALGIVLSVIHNFCVTRAEQVMISVLYVWLCIAVYYSFRAGTFYWMAFVMFRFAPFAAAVWLLRKIGLRLAGQAGSPMLSTRRP